MNERRLLLGVLGDTALRVRDSDPAAFAQFVQQTQSPTGRDVLALAASGMRVDLDALVQALRNVQAAPGSQLDQYLRESISLQHLLALARVVSNGAARRTDSRDVAAILEFARRHFGQHALTAEDRFLLAEAYLDAGQAGRAIQTSEELQLAELMPVDAALVRANAANPWIGSSDGSTVAAARWLAHVNDALRVDGLEPVSIMGSGATPLDSLHASAPAVATGPLVSVIMPTYNRGHELETAVRSVLSQTWTNLELLVVDDFSQESSRALVQRLAGSDSRIRVLRQDSNRGAYAARNLGLVHAAGEYVTVHDDDDWSHPRKIERQVRLLEERPDEVACLSWHCRVSESLSFVRTGPRPSYVHRNFSSLLFRREPVLQKAGCWQTVRKGGDQEFVDRLAQLNGRPLARDLLTPTSFTRAAPGSLTSGERARGHLDNRRWLYLHAFRAWHRRGPGVVGPDDESPFPVPASVKGTATEVARDVVLAADLRSGVAMEGVVQDAAAALRAGLRVGLLHVHSPRSAGRRVLDESVAGVVSQGADLLGLEDSGRVGLMVVRSLAATQFLDGSRTCLRPDRVVMVVDRFPIDDDGAVSGFDLGSCAKNLQLLFGVEPTIATTKAGVLPRLVALVGSESVAAEPWSAGSVLQHSGLGD